MTTFHTRHNTCLFSAETPEAHTCLFSLECPNTLKNFDVRKINHEDTVIALVLLVSSTFTEKHAIAVSSVTIFNVVARVVFETLLQDTRNAETLVFTRSACTAATCPSALLVECILDCWASML